MRTAKVEILSDLTNGAVLRHPDRRFPGVLVQGDTLYAMCVSADDVCASLKGRVDGDTYAELNELRNSLRSMLTHYKVVLAEHNVPQPFSE